MADTLATLKPKLLGLLQDQAFVLGTGNDQELDQAAREAVETYSLDRPRELVADILGDGATFDLTLPAGFVDGFSRVLAIEYPAGQRIPTLLAPEDWRFYRTASVIRLRLLTLTPESGATVRLTYTALHTLQGLDSAVATTIPAQHTEAFVWLAGAQALYRLAARWLHEQESSYAADVVNRASKTDEARRLANALMARYRELVRVQGGTAPALLRVDMDSTFAASGIGFLTHNRRRF